MPKNFGTMVPGADIDFSLNLAPKIPAGASLTAAAINVRSGGAAAQVTRTAIADTTVYLNIVALAPGICVFDVVGTFSSGRDDGEQCQVSVE